MTWEVKMKLKKLLIGLIAFLMFASPSFAQSFGVRLGFPIGVQYSSANPGNQGTGFRVALETSFFLDVVLQADLMLGQIQLSKGQLPISLFYGAGVHVGLGFNPVSVLVLKGGFFAGVQGTIGLELLVQPGLSLFVDTSLGLDVYFSNFGSAFSPIGFYYAGAFGISFKV
jgi:hypothetical protein